MPARSSISMLPQSVREKFEKKLIVGGFADYSALSDWLKAQGYEISRSAAHRHGQKFESRLAAIKIATEQAKAITAAVGDEEGAMGDALTRLCQEKAFKVLVDMEDPNPEGVDLSKMGVMIARLNRASVMQKKWMMEIKEKISGTLSEAKENEGMTKEDLISSLKKLYGL